MRSKFNDTLLEIARKDDRIFMILADIGYGEIEPFAQAFPDRFFNVGVAEQNMVGIAAGLALSGKKVFVYSIANFPIFRCLEQIRNDVCYHHLDVTVVTVGGGFAYGQCGASHHGVQDIAVMRALPHMLVVAPADPVETALAVRAIHQEGGPSFLRLQRAGDPVVHAEKPDFTLGKAIKLRSGKDVTLIGTGGILPNVLQAADILAEKGISASVLSMHTIKPIDRETIIAEAQKTKAFVTIEEHSIIGGLGSAVAEVLAEVKADTPLFKRLGIDDEFCHAVGGQEYLREKTGLSPDGIAHSVEAVVQGKS